MKLIVKISIIRNIPPGAGYIKMIELIDLFIFHDDIQFEKDLFNLEIKY